MAESQSAISLYQQAAAEMAAAQETARKVSWVGHADAARMRARNKDPHKWKANLLEVQALVASDLAEAQALIDAAESPAEPVIPEGDLP